MGNELRPPLSFSPTVMMRSDLVMERRHACGCVARCVCKPCLHQFRGTVYSICGTEENLPACMWSCSADPNLSVSGATSPLHWAAALGRPDCIELLLQVGQLITDR